MIKELEPDIINTSKFSPRPGTTASKLKKIDQKTMMQRSEKLHIITKNIAKKRNSRWLNWEGNVLIDEVEGGKLKARNQYYKSIIVKEYNGGIISDTKEGEDNYKNNGKISHFDGDLYSKYSNNHNNRMYLGKTIKVRITGYSNHTLEGIQIT